MGEDILIYGLNGSKRRYTRDLQGFADKVLAGGKYESPCIFSERPINRIGVSSLFVPKKWFVRQKDG